VKVKRQSRLTRAIDGHSHDEGVVAILLIVAMPVIAYWAIMGHSR